MPVKQVIVMRTDLNMRKGKMIAQGAHASLKVILNLMHKEYLQCSSGKLLVLHGQFGSQSPVTEWIKERFTKICVRVNSEDELHNVYVAASVAELPVALIVDSGKTEFNGVPTPTCVAIGPAEAEDIDKITGELKLL